MSFASSRFRVLNPASDADGKPLNYRAVFTGAVVDLGGSLVMSTVLGVAAVTGMLTRGDSPEMIAAELPQSLALALCVAAGGLLMSVAGGYVAANIAGRAQSRHACWAGAISVGLNLVVLAMIGDSGPAWLIIATLLSIAPFAALGGWLATPVSMVSVGIEQRSR